VCQPLEICMQWSHWWQRPVSVHVLTSGAAGGTFFDLHSTTL
jgi:hypothetical protein